MFLNCQFDVYRPSLDVYKLTKNSVEPPSLNAMPADMNLNIGLDLRLIATSRPKILSASLMLKRKFE